MVFMRLTRVLLVAHCVIAYPQLRLSKRAGLSGVATFNDYVKQGNTVCGGLRGEGGAFAAAASDISPDISGGRCSGTIDPSVCNGQSPVGGYVPPSCPKTNCGKCYSVTNKGALNGNPAGAGNTITIQIVDSCPSTNAQNFCKTQVPQQQRCMDPGVNQIDIDVSGYKALTGTDFGSGDNLNVEISELADCSAAPPGGSGTDTTENQIADETQPEQAASSSPAPQFQPPVSLLEEKPATTTPETTTDGSGDICNRRKSKSKKSKKTKKTKRSKKARKLEAKRSESQILVETPGEGLK